MNQEFVVKTSVWKAILYLSGSLLFVLTGVLLIYINVNFVATIVGIITVGFFGCGFFVGLFRYLLDRRPLIVIDEKGINDRRLGVGKVDWKDIKFVKLNSESTNGYIFLKLVNRDKYLKNLPRISKILSRFDGDLDFGIVNITSVGTDTKPEKIYEMISKYIPEKQINDLDRMFEIE